MIREVRLYTSQLPSYDAAYNRKSGPPDIPIQLPCCMCIHLLSKPDNQNVFGKVSEPT